MKVLIFVVDDEPDVEMLFLQQFRRDLKAGSFDLEFAFSAGEALDRLAVEDDRRLILLLSDINMPHMSGLELLPRVKALRPDLPVIMITAYGDADTRRRAMDGGADGLFPKPIDFGALREEIGRRLARQETPT